MIEDNVPGPSHASDPQTDPTPRHGPSNNIFALTSILTEQAARAFKRQLDARYNLTLAEWRIIVSVEGSPGVTASEITSRWGMDKMTINRAIKSLQGNGILQRLRDPSDLRSYQLNLTARGVQLYQEVRPYSLELYKKNTACLNETEINTMADLLVKLILHVRAS